MKILILIASLFFSNLLQASDPSPAPQEMPVYESFPAPIFTKMEQKQEKPVEVNNAFFSTAAKISNDVNRFLQAQRAQIIKVNVEKKKQFEEIAKKELEEWRAAHPKERASEFMKAQGLKRQELGAQLSSEKEQLEKDLKAKKEKFDKFMEQTRKEFRVRYNSYIDAMKLKEDPVKKEFKEIPKGPGIVLSPKKSDN